jgi:hypothetical protein
MVVITPPTILITIHLTVLSLTGFIPTLRGERMMHIHITQDTHTLVTDMGITLTTSIMVLIILPHHTCKITAM